MSYTKGPWEIARYTNHVGFSIWADGAGCIAERWYPSEREDAPIEANSKLIACAPEMAEMLLNEFGRESCVCKLNPFVDGPVPCNTCQKKELLKKAGVIE